MTHGDGKHVCDPHYFDPRSIVKSNFATSVANLFNALFMKIKNKTENVQKNKKKNDDWQLCFANKSNIVMNNYYYSSYGFSVFFSLSIGRRSRGRKRTDLFKTCPRRRLRPRRQSTHRATSSAERRSVVGPRCKITAPFEIRISEYRS